MTALPPTVTAPGVRGAPRTGRTAWTAVGLVLAAVIVAIWIVAVVHQQFNGSVIVRSATQTFSGEVTRVDISVTDGPVAVQGGALGPVRVFTTASSSSTVLPTDIEHLRKGTLTLRSTCPGTWAGICTRGYVVHVPDHVAVSVTDRTGPVEVIGTGGDVTVDAGDGPVRLQQVGAVKATSGTGSITVIQATGSVSLTAANGPITVAGVAGAFTADAATGSVTATGLSSPTTAVSADDGDVILRYDSVPTRVVASSGTGAVNVAVPPGSGPYDVQTTAVTGRTVSAVPSDPAADDVIQATSANGDVTVGFASG